MNKLLSRFSLKKVTSGHFLTKSYTVHIVDTKELEQEHIAFGRDGRLYNPELQENSISFLIKSKDTGDPVMAFSFFSIPNFLSSRFRFWYYEDVPEKLVNISLFNIVGSFEKTVITPGFIINKAKSAVDLIVFYDEVARQLFKIHDEYVFIEVAGKIDLDYETAGCDELCLTPRGPLKKVLGMINPDSLASFEYAQVNGYQEIENMYHIYTLGKVLFSPKLAGLYSSLFSGKCEENSKVMR